MMPPVSSIPMHLPRRRQQPQRQGPGALLLYCCTVAAALLARTATAFLSPSSCAVMAPAHRHSRRAAAAAATTTAAPQQAVGALVGKSFRDELITLMTVPNGPTVGAAAEEAGQAASVAQRIEFVVDKLAETYVPPQTLPFMNLLLEGTWVNAYNSWAVRRQVLRAQRAARQAAMQAAMEEMLEFVDDDELPAASRMAVEVRGFEQWLAPNATKGGVVNTVRWACSEGADAGLTGSLVVRAGYELNSRGILELAEPEHDLRLTQGPKEPEALVRAIQRAVPFDAFDPNGTFVETAFVDHEVRATKTHSTRFGTVINLFVKDGTELHKRMQDLGHLPPSPSPAAAL